MLKTSTRSLVGRIDWSTFGGLVLAFAGILGGLVLEGGRIHDVAQITAAAIVLGGTIGAVLISQPWGTIRSACLRVGEVLVTPDEPGAADISSLIVDLSRQVRRVGIASLEDEARATREPFLRKALGIAADGVDSRELRHIMELEIEAEQRTFGADAAVFEAAGGYAPTIGIIGAVIGLIQVMKHLDHLEEVGRGIAVAFVATVYGVALANILLLPIAAKILARARRSLELRELILVGVLAIAAGTNPRMIQLQLDASLSGGRARDEEPRSNGEQSGKVAQIG
jgi:chemotaxis protein MotA